MKKKFINIIIFLIILVIIGVSVIYFLNKKEKFLLPNKFNANFKTAERVKVAGICNPVPITNSTTSSCPSDAPFYTGNCKYPTSVIGKYMCESAGKDCAISGYPATCNNLSYSKEFLSNWMGECKSFIGDTSLNKIFIPGSHDTMTYGIPVPNFDSIGLPSYKDTPLLGADNLIDYNKFQTLIDSVNLALIVIPVVGLPLAAKLYTTPNVLFGIVALWARANANTVTEQLSAGIRYLDLRLTVNTQSGPPTIDNLNFTHTMLIPIKFLDVMKDINSWLDNNKKEIVIIDCQYITNLCSKDQTSKFYVDSEAQIKIQEDMLNGIQQIFKNKLSPNTLSSVNTYNEFIQKEYQVIIMFDQNSNGYDTLKYKDPSVTWEQELPLGGVMPFSDYNYSYDFKNYVRFVDYWSSKYKWLRNRDQNISSTFANNYDKNGDPSGSASEALILLTEEDGEVVSKYDKVTPYDSPTYEEYPNTDKFVVFGASVGLSADNAAHMIAYGLASPSGIDHPNGLLQMAANYGPVLINNIIGWFNPEFFYFNNDAPSYTYINRYMTPPTKITSKPLQRVIKAPKGIKTHNIFLYDNVVSFNVASLIIATIRGELSAFLPDPQPTVSDAQCHLKLASMSCGTDPGYDPNSCDFYEGRCYTQTGPQCENNSNCTISAKFADVCNASAGMSDLNCRFSLDGTNLCKCNGGIPKKPGFKPSKRFNCEMAKRTFGIPDDTAKNGFGSAPPNIREQYKINRCFIKPEYPVPAGKVWAITNIVCCSDVNNMSELKKLYEWGYVVCLENAPSTPSQSKSLEKPCNLNMNIGGSNNYLLVKYDLVDILSDTPVLTDIFTNETSKDFLYPVSGFVGIQTMFIPQHKNLSVISQNKGTKSSCKRFQGCWVKFEKISSAVSYLSSIGIVTEGDNSHGSIELTSYITNIPATLINRSITDLHITCGSGSSTLHLHASYIQVQRAYITFEKLGSELSYVYSNISGRRRMICNKVDDNLYDITEVISDYIIKFNISRPITDSVYLYVPIDILPNDPGTINTTTRPPINLECKINGYPVTVIKSDITLNGFLNIYITSNL